MVYKKINFEDRLDQSPYSFLVDGEKKTIIKDNDNLLQKGTNLNAENMNHLETGIYENSTQLENTKGTISSVSDTGKVTTEHKTQVNASLSSIASGSRSQVNASYNSTASNEYSQVNASFSSTASGERSQVNASFNSTASKTSSQVNASAGSTASGFYSQINCSNNVINNQDYTVVGGCGTAETSTKNRKWEISSKEGTIKATGAITGNSTFADFAEYFESIDDTKIPTGTIVTLQGDKIRPCKESEEMLGVISETAGVLLNASGFYWQDRYLRNEFGGLVYEKILDEESEKYITIPKENTEHDMKEEYIAREDRDEWNIVGLTGQVYIRIDDTVKVGDFIKSNDNGIATKNNNPTWQRWKVMKVTTSYNEEKGYGVALVFIR